MIFVLYIKSLVSHAVIHNLLVLLSSSGLRFLMAFRVLPAP